MHLSVMEPLLADHESRAREGLDDLALALEREAASLADALAPPTREAVADFLRIANSYYSNRIEGNDTHPGSIERAMRGDFVSDPHASSLQREAWAHVEVERSADEFFSPPDAPEPISATGLTWLHHNFYERVPPELRYVEDPATGRREAVVPGELRSFDVTVGRHVPPPPADIPAFLARIAEAYDPGRLHGLERTMAVATSHHRVLWIHPFGDGNGRVARLATTLYARRAGLGAVGLWSMSRGLARVRDRYMAALEDADAARRHDTDGRGVRSAEALGRFARFFLEVCMDQVSFMRSALRPEELGDRLAAYVRLRAEGVLKGPSDVRLRREAAEILRATLLRGWLPRGEALGATRLPERTARVVLGALLREGLLVSATPKGPVRLAFPSRVAPYLFPGLYPEGVADA